MFFFSSLCFLTWLEMCIFNFFSLLFCPQVIYYWRRQMLKNPNCIKCASIINIPNNEHACEIQTKIRQPTPEKKHFVCERARERKQQRRQWKLQQQQRRMPNIYMKSERMGRSELEKEKQRWRERERKKESNWENCIQWPENNRREIREKKKPSPAKMKFTQSHTCTEHSRREDTKAMQSFIMENIHTFLDYMILNIHKRKIKQRTMNKAHTRSHIHWHGHEISAEKRKSDIL